MHVSPDIVDGYGAAPMDPITLLGLVLFATAAATLIVVNLR
jgi:hypothetical protein